MNLYLSLFVSVILVNVSFCQDSRKYIIKSYDSPYCIYIAQNVTVQPCTWNLKNSTATVNLVRLSQQLVSIHPEDSSDSDKGSSEEVHSHHASKTTDLLPSNKPQRYIIRPKPKQTICLTALETSVGVGKCGSKSKFGIHLPSASVHGSTIESRGECIGFEGNGPRLIKKPCQYATKTKLTSPSHENVLHQLWVFCTEDGQCRLTPSNPNEMPHSANTMRPQTSTNHSHHQNKGATKSTTSNSNSTVAPDSSFEIEAGNSTETSGSQSALQFRTTKELLSGIFILLFINFVINY